MRRLGARTSAGAGGMAARTGERVPIGQQGLRLSHRRVRRRSRPVGSTTPPDMVSPTSRASATCRRCSSGVTVVLRTEAPPPGTAPCGRPRPCRKPTGDRRPSRAHELRHLGAEELEERIDGRQLRRFHRVGRGALGGLIIKLCLRRRRGLDGPTPAGRGIDDVRLRRPRWRDSLCRRALKRRAGAKQPASGSDRNKPRPPSAGEPQGHADRCKQTLSPGPTAS